MRLALYQPDIPQNAGAIMRLAACFSTPVDVIEPCGFVLSDQRMRRAGMDYVDLVDWTRHASWQQFLSDRSPGRLVLLTTRGEATLDAFSFQPDDTLLFGRESAGVPDDVHTAADMHLRVPIADQARSLNVATTAAIVLWEALRQTGGTP